MAWTILILVVAIALYMFSFMLVKFDAKKATLKDVLLKNGVTVFAILLIAGSVSRLYTPIYLTKTNPGILQEMVAGLQAQQAAEQAKKDEARNKEIAKMVKDNIDELIADAPIAGNVEAKNTIFLWSDYSCPYCRRVHGELSRVLKERDDVRVVLKNFSIHGILSDAPAQAVIAAKLQDNAKAAALDKLLMDEEYYADARKQSSQEAAQKSINENVMKLAKKAGLDTKKLAADMKGEVVARELKNVRELAQRFEITGTPFLIINGKTFPGAIPYARIIDALEK